MRCSIVTPLAESDAKLTCEPEDLCFALPVRARRASARERLPSYREPASRNPQAVHTEAFRNPRTRAPVRLLSIRAPRQAVLRTSSRLAPSRFTNRPCDLPVEKTRDASNRCLPPKRTACTRTSRVPGSLSRFSPRGDPTESWAPCGTTGGPDVSRRPVVRFGGSSSNAALEQRPHGLLSRAWAFCSHGADAIEPLTPLSRAPFTLAPRSPSGALHAWPCVRLLNGLARVGGCGDRRDHR